MSEVGAVNHDKRRYPLLCRLRGHRWYQKPDGTRWYRDGSCRRCALFRAPRRERPRAEWPPIERIFAYEPRVATDETGMWWTRRDLEPGETPPPDWAQDGDRDETTGEWRGWVPIDPPPGDVVGAWEPSDLSVRMTEICWCDDECGTRPCVTYARCDVGPDSIIFSTSTTSRAAMRAARSLIEDEKR